MRWSEVGLAHLLALRVAWVNQRFDVLFADNDLSLPIISPNPSMRPASVLERLASIHTTIGDRLELPSKTMDGHLVLNFRYGKSS